MNNKSEYERALESFKFQTSIVKYVCIIAMLFTVAQSIDGCNKVRSQVDQKLTYIITTQDRIEKNLEDIKKTQEGISKVLETYGTFNIQCETATWSYPIYTGSGTNQYLDCITPTYK